MHNHNSSVIILESEILKTLHSQHIVACALGAIPFCLALRFTEFNRERAMMETVLDEQEVLQVFNIEEVNDIILKVIKQTLGNASFNSQKVDQWTSSIIETILKTLQPQNKPFKYIVTAIIMQRTGAGLHSSCVAHWDAATDGMSYFLYINYLLAFCLTISICAYIYMPSIQSVLLQIMGK